MFVKDLPCDNITIKVLNTWFILCKSRRIEAEAMMKLSQSVDQDGRPQYVGLSSQSWHEFGV